jgi:hypothetical protein
MCEGMTVGAGGMRLSPARTALQTVTVLRRQYSQLFWLMIEACHVQSLMIEEDIVSYGEPGGTAGVTVALR